MRNLRILLCGFCLLAGMIFCQDSYAAEKYVYDEAFLLTMEETEELEQMAGQFSERWGMDFGVATTDDALGKTSRDYADDFYDAHFDISDERGGVLYLIDMDNREIYLSTCGQAIRYLTDERIERILDEAYAEIADGDYYGTFEAFFEATEEYLERGIPSGQYNYDTETGERDYYQEPKIITRWEIMLAVLAGAAAAFGTCGFIVGKYRLKFEDFHYDAYTDSKISLSVNEDRLVNTFVTHRHIPKNDGHSSSGGGSGSSVHHSSGGVSHGGGGRKF